MANIIIDQQTYDLDPRHNLLEAALSVGLDLPYFCWHPALGSVGSCRQCAVQQFADASDCQGRTVMACMTPVTPNARFSIAHETATAFRKQVIEWMMINHPHDCPVCDEGGECHLQDMTVMTGHNMRRHRFSKRTFNNQNLGPFINHEMNRCITCYRCVRFYRDVAGGDDLRAFKSADRVYFGRSEEGALKSEFSGNLVEVCPTGVFTDKVFHQKYTRKWDLATAPSICQLCSVGCNISPGERYGDLRRVQNRFHPDVNGYFLCDRGRFGHEFVNAPERLGHKDVADVAKVGQLLKQSQSVIGIGSPRASLEANWALQKLVGAENFYDGLLPTQSAALAEVMAVLSSKDISTASLKDIAEADAILIVGEDITNSAPMMALSVRQAVIQSKKSFAEEELKIPSWNDTAMRDFACEHSLPIFSAHAMACGLDDLPQRSLIAHPEELVGLLKNLAASFSLPSADQAAQENPKIWANEAKEALLKAKRPVVIGGATLGDPHLIREVANLAKALNEKNGATTKISLVVPDSNSIGLAALRPQSLAVLDRNPIDVAIVVENDLSWRLGENAFGQLCERVKHLVVIDSLRSETAQRATTLLPSLTFAESSGTIVSQEGRLQRYFSVFRGEPGVECSWRVIASMMADDCAKKWRTLDDINAEMRTDLEWPEGVFECLFDANFKVDGHGIPRFTSEYSGRTAMNADVTMHEPKPPTDVDSPLLYSMEGARRRVPLPLISSSLAPRWNSVQSSFKQEKEPSGVKLFGKEGMLKASLPGAQSEGWAVPKASKSSQLYVVPRPHIFGSEERARFARSLSSRMPTALAHISASDAHKLHIRPGSKISVNCEGETRLFWVNIEKNQASGVLALPLGLVDASLFYKHVDVEEIV